MSSSDSFRKELQKDLMQEIIKCKSNYSNLATMSDEITTEIHNCNEHFISCFIKYELLEECIDGTNTRTEDILSKHRERFMIGDIDDWGPYSSFTHTYNFGDIVFDEKRNTNAIVLNEKKVFISLWYHGLDDGSAVIRQRKKTDNTVPFDCLKESV